MSTTNNTLLLHSSSIFNNSELLDRIHQSFIDLETNPPKQDIHDLLLEALPYIDKNLDQQTADEIIYLISSCFIHYPDLPSNIINDILKNSRCNSNRIILTASICSDFNGSREDLSFNLFRSFVRDTFRQILIQFRNDKENSNLTIFNNVILAKHKANFIIDMLLITDLSEKSVSLFSPYIFSQKSISEMKLNKFISKISANGLISTFPESILAEKKNFVLFSMDNLSSIIINMSDEMFKKILPFIEETFSKTKNWNRSFVTVLLYKCMKLGIKFKLINNLVDSLTLSQMKPNVWNYLAKMNVTLPDKLANQIDVFPSPAAALKIMPNIDNIPPYIVAKGLLANQDLEVYENILFPEFVFSHQINIFTKSKFWNQLMSVISSSEKKCTSEFIEDITEIFKNYIEKAKSFDIISEMMFCSFPPTENGNFFLNSFISKLDSNYKEEFENNLIKIIQRIISLNVLPLPSFWQWVNIYRLVDILEKDKTNPVLLYAYEYSLMRDYVHEYNELNIYQLTKAENQKLILEFMKSDYISYFPKLNIENLSFIINARIFVRNEQNTTVNGLTKELILPFFAISLNFFTSIKKHFIFLSPEMEQLLFEGCKLLSNTNSTFLIESIDAIISKFDILIDHSLFSIEITFKMLEILFDLLLNGTYSGNKTLLISTIFTLSNKNEIDQQESSFLFKHGYELFKFMIKNMNDIPDFSDLKNIKMDFGNFPSFQIMNLVIDIVQKPTEKSNFIPAIYFIEQYCKNVPQIKIKKKQNIIQIFKELIDERKWDDILVVGQFMKKNELVEDLQTFFNISFPYQTKMMLFSDISPDSNPLDNLVSTVLYSPHPEDENKIDLQIFDELMKEESIREDFFVLLFEKSPNCMYTKAQTIMNYLHYYYNKYNDSFVNAFRRIYSYHSIQSSFVRKYEFQSLTLPISSIGQSIITRLYNEINSKENYFQAFCCLFNIAAAFPFLFSQNPQEIFDIVLQPFDYFTLYFTIKDDDSDNEELINKGKTAVSAIAFFISTLYSVNVIDAFFPWLFKNIFVFSDSQVLAFMCILAHMFGGKLRNIVLSILMKYEFLGICTKLLPKQIKEEICDDYKSSLYHILSNYFFTLNETSCKTFMIWIDEIRKIDNPFNFVYKNFLTVDFECSLSEFLPMKPGPIYEFWVEISESKKYWKSYNINWSNRKSCSDADIEKFSEHYFQVEENIPDVKNMPPLPHIYAGNVKFVRFLATQPDWAFQYICEYHHSLFLPEHVKKLLQIEEELKELRNHPCEELNIQYNTVKVYDFFLSEYCQSELFSYLLNEMTTYKQNIDDFMKEFISNITANPTALLSLLEMINVFIIEKKNNFDSIKPINKLVNFMIEMNNYENIMENFFEICGENLIDLVLSPDYRHSSKLLSKVAQLFVLSNKLPKNITHLVGFMLITNNSQIIPQALELCSKIGEQNVSNVKKIIEQAFENEYKKKDPSFEVIDCFLEKAHSLISNKIESLPSMLDSFIDKYKKNGRKDENSVNIICMLFTILAPERKKNQLIITSDEIDFNSSLDKNFDLSNMKQTVVYPAPQNLKETDEFFWNLYDKHRNVLNEILFNDERKLEKLKFLLDFPELISFSVRFNYFRDKMKEKINPYSTIFLIVSRSNVLESSFKNMQHRTIENWLSKINVKFQGEKGYDAGGLTREWFTLLAKELFNTNNGLFISSENKSYQPNPSSNIQKEHIEYFKFSGRFIARALLECQCINAHLTRSFLRQILGSKRLRLRDLEDFDEELYKSLENLLAIDEVDELDLNFTIDVNEFGSSKTILLKDGGDKTQVTNSNRKEYVGLYANFHLRKSILPQIEAFRDGFNSLVPQDIIRIFSPSELDLLICGIPEIDVDDLRKNTVFHPPYSDQHEVVVLFFGVISGWDNENLARFLLFLTGSSQVPVRGFADYAERGKPITIAYGGEKNRLCVAHTCFNTLDLPEYETEEEMNSKLLRSIKECEFGLI